MILAIVWPVFEREDVEAPLLIINKCCVGVWCGFVIPIIPLTFKLYEKYMAENKTSDSTAEVYEYLNNIRRDKRMEEKHQREKQKKGREEKGKRREEREKGRGEKKRRRGTNQWQCH